MPEAQTLERKLDVESGALADVFPLFDSSTLQHANEIMTARRTDASLRNRRFWTADFPMYGIEDGEAVLYFAPREHNLIFRDIQNATSQLLLLRSQNYVPPKEGIEEVVAASKTGVVLKVNLSNLRLKGIGTEWKYFEVDTNNLDSLNPDERKFADRIYGQNNVGKTRIYVLNPDYVKKQLKGKEESAIGRASSLGWADAGSWFNADDRNVDYVVCGLRGVLKESAEDAAPILISLRDIYK